jgi:hypothetical protein
MPSKQIGRQKVCAFLPSLHLHASKKNEKGRHITTPFAYSYNHKNLVGVGMCLPLLYISMFFKEIRRE